MLKFEDEIIAAIFVIDQVKQQSTEPYAFVDAKASSDQVLRLFRHAPTTLFRKIANEAFQFWIDASNNQSGH